MIQVFKRSCVYMSEPGYTQSKESDLSTKQNSQWPDPARWHIFPRRGGFVTNYVPPLPELHFTVSFSYNSKFNSFKAVPFFTQPSKFQPRDLAFTSLSLDASCQPTLSDEPWIVDMWVTYLHSGRIGSKGTCVDLSIEWSGHDTVLTSIPTRMFDWGLVCNLEHSSFFSGPYDLLLVICAYSKLL